MNPEKLRTWLSSAGLHLLLALVATAPMAISLPHRLVGHPDVDVWNHAWGPWWFWHSLSQGQLPYATDLLMAPKGGLLWYIDPVGALLAAPLVPLIGVVAAWNLLILGNVLLASWTSRRLALAMGASPAASWVASAAMVCSPFLISEIHNGVSEAVGIGWPLLALLACWRALHQERLGAWLLAGLALGLAGVASYYYGLAAGIVAAGWFLLLRPAHWPSRLLGGLLAAGLVAAMLLPVGWAIQRSLGGADPIIARAVMDEQAREFLMAHNAVDPRSFLWPGDFQSVDLASRGEAFRHSAYLGLAALGLALWSRRWRVLLAAAVVGVLALGPWLWWNGDWVTTASGARIPLPTQLLDMLLPAVATTHFQRLCLPLLGTVAALAAVGATRLPRWAGLAAVLVVAVDGLLIGPSPWPVARAPALDWRAHEAIAAQPPERRGSIPIDIVVDLPVEVGATMQASRYLLYQAASGRPIPNRVDPRFDTSVLVGNPSFTVLAVPTMTREPFATMLRSGVANIPQPMNIDAMRELGVQFLVLHTELCAPDEAALIRKQLDLWYGPAQEHGPHLLWATRDAPSSAGTIHPEIMDRLPPPNPPVEPQRP